MTYKTYIKNLIFEALAPKIKQSLKQKWKTEVPTLTEPQMDYYIDAFEKYKNDPKIVQKDITKYSFHELESVIDSNFIVKKPQSEISAEPIYQKDNLTIWEAADRDQCIKIGRGESWCISRSDASNMYNTYRYRMGEPNFYFIKDSSKPETDKWSFFVLMVFKDGTFGLASRANSSPFTGSEEYSWEEVVRNAPALKPFNELFKSKPLTDEERRIYELIRYRVQEPDLLKHFKKLSIVEQYIGFGRELTEEQFQNLNNKELRMKYINTGNRIESLDSLSPTEINRYIQIRMELDAGSLDLGRLTSLPPNFKFPETIKGHLILDRLTSLPPNFKLPETIGGSLDLRSLTSLPPNFKLPETIGGYLHLRSLTSLPPNFEFPKKIGGHLHLNRLTSLPPNFKLPETIGGSLHLVSLTSLPPNFKFPETIGGSLHLVSLTSLPPNFKFPETIKGHLSLDNLTSLPPNFKFPETIGGSLYLDRLTSLPPNIKFPETIKGDLNLDSLTSLPSSVWNSMSDQVKSIIPKRLIPT